MLPRLPATVFAVVASLGVSAVAVGVKETAKLTIVAPDQQPVVITDPSVLELSNVFVGSFISSPAPEPDAAWPRYTIIFDVRTLDGIKQAAYVVHYCVSASTGEGFVYLPGHGNDWYRRNISTILRDDQDGKWHRAADAWSAAINPRLNGQTRR